MPTGSVELVRLAAAWFATAAFVVTYLTGQVQGTTPETALIRGAIVAGLALVVGRWLLAPAVYTVLDAMARDRAAALAKAEADEAHPGGEPLEQGERPS